MDRKSGAEPLHIPRTAADRIVRPLCMVLMLSAAGLLPAESSVGSDSLLGKLLAELDDTRPPEDRHRLLMQAAGIEELCGALSEAQRHYQEAAFVLPGRQDLRSLLSSAQLLYELNKPDGAEAQARAIMASSDPDAPREDALLLIARILADRGEVGRAARLVDEASAAGMSSPPLLLLTAELALSAGNAEAMEGAVQRLAVRYPDSPEHQLARSLSEGGGGPYGFFPAPSRYLSDRAPVGPADEPKEQDAAVPPSTADPAGNVRERVWVQTGSFLETENAEALAASLRKDGFSARVLERDIGAKRYFKVVTPTDGDERNLQDLIQRMKTKGYETFLLFE